MWGALGADPMPVAGGVSPQSLSEWRMQNIARDSENSSEEEFFDAHGTVGVGVSVAPAQGGLDVPGRGLAGLGSRDRSAPHSHGPPVPPQRTCLTATRSLPRR